MNKSVIIFLAAVALTGCNKPQADTGTAQADVKKADKPQAEEKKPLGPVFAHKVYNDYLTDPKEAKKTYSGKDVQLVGHVWDVDRAGGKVVMYLSVTDYATGKADNRGVEATFVPPVGYGELERGERVLIQGRCNGKALGTVNFGNCQFIRKVEANEFK